MPRAVNQDKLCKGLDWKPVQPKVLNRVLLPNADFGIMDVQPEHYLRIKIGLSRYIGMAPPFLSREKVA
jgi:hypothetical protein